MAVILIAACSQQDTGSGEGVQEELLVSEPTQPIKNTSPSAKNKESTGPNNPDEETAATNSITGLGSFCSDKESCQVYCEENKQACIDYCENNFDTNALCQVIMDQKSGCTTFEECEIYCVDHPEDISCINFFEDSKMEMPELSMPFDISGYSPADWGIWPFCVHGGDHPEGHGGIDFELKQGTKILSAVDGQVEYIEKAETEGEHGNGLMIESGGLVVSYHGLENIQVNVGDQVTKGQYIGDPVKLENEYYIHFETNNYHEQKLECPVPYLDSEFSQKLEQMFSQASYPEQGSEPLICNCDWLPYKENMAAGP